MKISILTHLVELWGVGEGADEVGAGAVVRPVAPVPGPHVRRLLPDLAAKRILETRQGEDHAFQQPRERPPGHSGPRLLMLRHLCSEKGLHKSLFKSKIFEEND